MNRILDKILDEKTDKFSSSMKGMGREALEEGCSYIDELIKTALKSCPDSLVYNGLRILSPKEEFMTLISGNNSKLEYDIASSDLYKIVISFTYVNKLIEKYIYMPFARANGEMKFSNIKYQISPILSDTVISPSMGSIFIRLIRDKLNYSQVNHTLYENGHSVSGQMVYATIYRVKKQLSNKLGKIFPPTAAYLFGKYGVIETFKKYAFCDVLLTEDEVDKSLYEDHFVYSSTGAKPKGLKVNEIYKPNKLKIIIKKNDKSHLTDNLITGLMYIFDVFPDSLTEMLEVMNEDSNKREIEYFRILLGTIIFKGNYTDDRLVVNMNDHFNSLESYIPNMIKSKLAEIDFFVDDIFDLQAKILENFNNWLVNSKEMNNNLFSRYLDIIYYLLFDVMLGINTCLDEISRRFQSGVNTPSYMEIMKTFNEKITPKRIFSVIKSSGANLCLNMLDVAGDNMIPRGTSIMAMQESGDGVQKGKKSGLPPHLRIATASSISVGSVYGMKKKDPTPLSTLNPYLIINSNGRIRISKEEKEENRLTDFLLTQS